MKKIYVSIVLSFLMVLPQFLSAQYARREKLVKIGYVNIQYAMKTYSKGRSVINFLKNLKASYAQKTASMEQDIKKLEKELEIKSKDLSESSVREYLTQIEKKRQELEIFVRNANKDIAKKESEMLKPLYQKIIEVVKKVAENYKFNFVIDSKYVLVADPELNITNAVIKELERSR